MGIIKNIGKAIGESAKFFKDLGEEIATNCREVPSEIKRNIAEFKEGFAEGSKDPQETTDNK